MQVTPILLIMSVERKFVKEIMYFFMSTLRLLFLLSAMFHFINAAAYPSSFSTHDHQQPLCHDDESSVLLQFKQSFEINKLASIDDPSAYPKVSSWKPEETNDCCLWDGVWCDGDSGHVVELDLSSSWLYGFINSSSTLFRLVHLQRLNLAYNDFNLSQIPSGFSHFPKLVYLNLSMSNFSSQIPPQVLELSKLVSLDLSFNPWVKIQKPGLKNLVQNLTNLKLLFLARVNISSTVPRILANLSSLTSLSLRHCNLYGEFPVEIFKLPNLQILSVGENPDLNGHLPQFQSSSPLQILRLLDMGFSGQPPDSIGNLKSLSDLDISNCNFSGLIPSSFGNLTNLVNLDLSSNNFIGQIPSSFANFTQLSRLSLSNNNFSPGTLSWLGKQTKLTSLWLVQINLNGDIPSSLKNLSQLSILFLGYNQLTGQIPSWLANLTQLTVLDLPDNKMHGSIQQSISRLVNLEDLNLLGNYLNGIVNFDLFLKLKNLVYLQISHVHLSFPINSTSNSSTLPKFRLLGLPSCNITEFPSFLRFQDEMQYLYLDHNKLHGQLPKWMFNIGKETLSYLRLEFNFLTGFDQTHPILPWANLCWLSLDSNKLQGSLPIPPPSIIIYSVSNNTLSGEISPMFCNLNLLFKLDLSYNNLSGMLPQCLSNLSNSLSILNLGNNNFHGTIHATYMKGCRLKMIDVSQNHLQGILPRSLSNCMMLEILHLGNNQFNDNFPSWLGDLPELGVLILRFNRFQGAIGRPDSNFVFPKLHIIDLSYNNFTGKLPSEYFQNLNFMKIANADKLTYMHEVKKIDIADFTFVERFDYSIKMTNKGVERTYQKIQELFVAIDLSSNRFEGKIPEVIEILKGLRLLNLSNNILIGHIPSSLGNLNELESLDLSQNNLSGEIPQQLMQLTFLAFLNVSNNYLSGPIPQGKQFATFQNDSYVGNIGLCGSPLTKKCKESETLPQPPLNSKEGKDSNFPSTSDWIVIIMGYGSGLIIGWVIGFNYVPIRKFEKFAKNFRRRQ